MKVEEYNIFWKHSKYKPKPWAKDRDMTECIVEQEGRVLSTGEAKCNYKDNPNRKIALKVSLKKAISGFSKDMRTAIWNKFLKEMIETLYYTVHDSISDYGEGAIIRLYEIRNNIPILIFELDRNLDSGLSDEEELHLHIEDLKDHITYVFERL